MVGPSGRDLALAGFREECLGRQARPRPLRLGGDALLAQGLRRSGLRAQGRGRHRQRRASGSRRPWTRSARTAGSAPASLLDQPGRQARSLAAHADAQHLATLLRGHRRPAGHPRHDALHEVGEYAARHGLRRRLLAQAPRRRQHRERLLALQPHRRAVAAGPGPQDPSTAWPAGTADVINWHNVNLAQGFRGRHGVLACSRRTPEHLEVGRAQLPDRHGPLRPVPRRRLRGRRELPARATPIREAASRPAASSSSCTASRCSRGSPASRSGPTAARRSPSTAFPPR